MIGIIVGGIGQGKSLTMVKEIIDRKQLTFTNFKLWDYKNYLRLRREHLFKKVIEGKTTKLKLNFEYWKEIREKSKGFDICLDEFHNLMSSRRSMSKPNVLLSDWLSQIRKILGESEHNNLYLVTQKLRRIDVNSRDLSHFCILCQKVINDTVMIPTKVRENGRLITKNLPLIWIYKYYFSDPDFLNMFEMFGQRTYYKMTRFLGNDYLQYFDSYALIDMGAEEYI